MRLSVFSCAARRLSAWLLSAFVVLLALPSYAQIDVPSNWPLKPAGLGTGDEFRLLLMARNGLKATSTNIADYDAFVQEIIARIGHADIREYSANFKVLASTATVDARDHTGTTGAEGVPIYWLNGSIVATSYSDLYDGSWPNKGAATLQDGVPISSGRSHQAICTGTGTHGSATALPLGAQRCTSTTIATTTSALGGKTHPNSARARYLALSDVFRVGDFTDTTVPTITGVEITSDPGSDGEYVAGDVVEVTVTFSESVTVTGTPLFRLTLDTAKRASYVAADSTATELVFSYTVTAADYAHDGIDLPRNAVELNGGAIQNQAGTVDADLAYQSLGGQFGHRVYIPPTVSGVSVASTPSAHGIYSTGETIQLDLTWDRKIAVFGSPLLHFFVAEPDDARLGGDTRTAAYTTTIGDHVTRFEYEVQAQDSDSDGISLLAQGNIEWNGAHIIRQGHGDHADKDAVNAPNLGGPSGLPAQPGHRVNVSPSTDASLSLLQLLDGNGNAISLNPAFDSETTLYTASVANAVSRITAAPAVSDDGATVEYLDGGNNAIADADGIAEGQQVALAVNANIVRVKVTAEDGVTTRTYAVTVTRAAANAAATGKPAISGTAQVGQTLMAGLGTIADADGVPGAVAYQWVRVDADGSSNPTDIGTNSSTYTPVAADVGKKIRVEVSFTDDGGTAEGPLASDAVPKTGTVVTANSVACPADSDWCTEVTLSYASNSITDSILSERWGFGSDATPGAIEDATFSHGGTAYTINGLELYRFTMTGSGASDLVTLKVRSGDLPDGTVLTLDGTEFTIDERSDTPDTGKEQWSFGPPGLPFDWGQGRKVTVSLKLPPAGAATGKPAVAGAPQVGETLTAGTGTVADVDGVPGTLTYQWVRVDADGASNPTNIGTNSSTYAPVTADVGKKIRVEVSFTDGGGNAEGPLASNAVPEAGTVVPAKAACPADADWCTEMTLYYTAAHQPHFYERWGYTSISTPSGAIDDNTFSRGGREYTIERLGLNRDHLNSGSNDLLTFDLTYVPVSGELPDGTVLTLDGVEFTVGIVSDTLETGKEQWSPNSMGISLNWVKGQKVTTSLTFPAADATLGALALTDGDGNAISLNPAFQSATTLYTASVDNAVSRIEVAPTTNEGGATVDYLDGRGTAIADADGNDEEQQVALAVGPNTIGVKVTAADRVATRTYTLTVTRAPGSAAATGKPAIAGTAQVGHTLTAGIGTIADDDGLPSTFPDDYTFQWVRVDAEGTNPEDIADATGHTYTPVAADGGKKIRVKVSFTDNTDTPEGPLESDATATVAAVSADATLTALVLGDEHGSAIALDPTFESGKTSYTASVGNAVAEITVTPELSDDDATVAYLDGSDSAIADADTGATGQQVALAVGPNTIKVKVTAEDGATQTYTVVVSRSGGNPAIVGTAQVGHTLTAGKGEIDDAEGTTKADNGDAGYAYTYQWVRVDADGTSNPHDIGSATSNTYTLVAADEGKKVKVKLSFKDDADNVEERTSDAWPASGTVAAGGGGLIATLVEREPVEGTGGRLHYVFDLHLSTGVSKSYRDVRDHVFTVAGGSTVGARRIHRDNQPRPGTNQLALVSNHWRVEVRPSADRGEVTVAMTANRTCDQDGALCALDGSTLSNAPSLILASSYPTLSIADTSADEDDGELRFTITLSRASQRYDVLYDVETVAGGSATEDVDYTAQARVTNRIQKGAVTQEFVVPLIDDAVDDDGETVKVRIGNAKLEDDSGAQKTITIARAEATGTIGSADTTTQPVPDALTASFEDVPLEHNGYTHFKLRLAFSAPIVTSATVLRDQALTVTGGAVTAVRQVNGRSDLWEITVDQSGLAPVTVRLAASAPCDQPGAVCTADGRALSNAPSATVQGKPALSVADAEVEEAPGAMLVFVVTLDRPPTAPVTVNWKTLDRTATAGQDYTEASGSIAFDVGETEKTISVAVLDDAIDEGDETLFLLLPSAQGARSVDPLAVGTIRNSDPLQQAWLARFGRTVAEQVVDAVEERIRSAPEAGVQVTLAGKRIGGGTASAQDPGDAAARAKAQEEAEARERLAAVSRWLRGEAEKDRTVRSGWRPVTNRELLTGSSFVLSAQADGMGGGIAAVWGRGAWTRFNGREGELSLSGEVTNALLGADWTRDPGSESGAGGWTAGLMLSHARGSGTYRGASAGTVESTVTGVYPYGRYAMTDRVTLWGVAGYGAGTLTLKPKGGAALRTGLDLRMAAAGLRGTVVKAPAGGGPELTVETDAMAVRTSSDARSGGAGGNLAAAAGEATRLRLGLEGAWRGLAVAGGTLAPRLEIGMRHDGGDAETGFGLDAGAGLAWSDAARGIRADLSGRGILTHASGGFRERGVAGALSWQPRPERGRGPKLIVRHTMGGPATGGVNALLSRRTLTGMAAGDDDPLANRRLEVRFGYGFAAFGDRFTATPEIGFGMSSHHREYSLGWRLGLARGGPTALELRLEASRREAANGPGSGSGASTDPEHMAAFRLTANW